MNPSDSDKLEKFEATHKSSLDISRYSRTRERKLRWVKYTGISLQESSNPTWVGFVHPSLSKFHSENFFGRHLIVDIRCTGSHTRTGSLDNNGSQVSVLRRPISRSEILFKES